MINATIPIALPVTQELNLDRASDAGKLSGSQEAGSFKDAFDAAARDEKAVQQEPKQETKPVEQTRRDEPEKPVMKTKDSDEPESDNETDTTPAAEAAAGAQAAAQVTNKQPSDAAPKPETANTAETSQDAIESVNTAGGNPIQTDPVEEGKAAKGADVQVKTHQVVQTSTQADQFQMPDNGEVPGGQPAKTVNTEAEAVANATALRAPVEQPKAVDQQTVVDMTPNAGTDQQVDTANKDAATDSVKIAMEGAKDNKAVQSTDAGPAHAQRASGRETQQAEASAASADWQFDGSSRVLQFNSSSQQANTDAVTSVAGAGVSSANSGGASTANNDAGSASANSQTNMPFAAMVQEAAAKDAAAKPVDTGKIDGAELKTRVIDQVVKEVRLHRFSDRNDLVVRLSPPELGTLRLRVTQDASGLSSQISASNEQVKGLLQAHLPALMDALAEAGIQVDAVSVGVDTPFNTFAQNAGQQNTQQQSGQSRQRHFFGQMGTVPQPVAISANSAYMAGGQMNYNWFA